MEFEYTKNIKEIVRIPNKFPAPDDVDTTRRLIDLIDEEKLSDLMHVAPKENNDGTYDVIFKKPYINNYTPFIGSREIYCTEIKETEEYPIGGSNHTFHVTNIFNGEAQEFFRKNMRTGKTPELFIYIVLGFLYGNDTVVKMLEQNFNIYSIIKEKIDPVIEYINEVCKDKIKFSQIHEGWSSRLLQTSAEDLIGQKYSLRDLIELYILGNRYSAEDFLSVNFEVFNNENTCYKHMSGISVELTKNSINEYKISKVIYHKRRESVLSFNELDYFFPLFQRSEIIVSKEKEEIKKRRTLGSFFLDDITLDSSGNVESVGINRYFFKYCVGFLNLKKIEIHEKTRSSNFEPLITNNEHLSSKDKAIFNILLFIMKSEILDALKEMNIKIEEITTEEFDLLKIQLKNNEGIKLEDMFDSSFELLRKTLSKKIDILNDLKFDYKYWDQR